MNNILQLKGKFYHRKNPSGYGPVNLPKNSKVTKAHIEKLKRQLKSLEIFWNGNNIIGGALVTVHYRRIVPKSSRLGMLLGESGKSPI